MRHYEIILMINPEKNKKIFIIIEEYNKLIHMYKGIIHRFEDWGKRSLSYTIKNLKKAHYFLMNIEVSSECIKELENSFKFNINIIRYFILTRTKAHKKISPILKNKEENKKELNSSVIKINKNIKKK
ncbi:30S ribosomal protein S6 [Buchnera aphidicola]|uniref:Small ribosomal subunit protein bS6 n=1 Tax=Buchnera aphidicola subsp. Cinara cedri (strain Cc) TaxID=372461 RepID=RS6_BUCCC|nr:30S ribosomal protein S6 [Buchnera aphidicola]Q056X8.1 RecName: Full=Small ribosomal subunit protein bS6; AltName: Full=30S ribosomal protein S6 [Buchnera aphidicola BCc]ABJ90821.1 30S ribosomal protein S6 [Buchnera aphidicola BCc]